MPARATWKGFLRINQLTVPVKAFSAVRSGPDIPLHQLHRECRQPIRQQKVCPIHGVLESKEIQSGYQIAEGEFLPLETADLDELRPSDDKLIAVDCFVAGTTIDAVYHSGQTYYLVPDEPPGQKPFCVLRDGMRQLERCAIARVVMQRQERVVLLRPLGKLVAMTVLAYAHRVRPAEEYEGEVAGMSAGPAERELICQLIASLTETDVDLARYKDHYVEQLNHLIEQRLAPMVPRAAGRSAPDSTDDADLVAALRAILATATTDLSPAASRVEQSPAYEEQSNRKIG